MFIATGSIGALRPATIAFRTTSRSAVSGSSWAFNGIGIGAADPTRYVLVWAIPSSGSSVVVNGIGAPRIGATNWFLAAVPTGTAANITLSASGTFSSAGINVWTMTLIRSTAQTGLVAIGQNATNPKSTSITVNKGGVAAVTGYTSGAGSTTQNYTWGGSIAGDFLGTTPSGGIVLSAAHVNPAAATGSYGITYTRTSGVANFGLDAISFR